jgi:hypothetical protein
MNFMYTEAFRKEKLATETGNNMTTSYADLDYRFDNDRLLSAIGMIIGGLLGWVLLVLCYRWVCRRGHGTTESSGAPGGPGPATIPEISGLTAAALQSLGSSVVGTAPGDAENSSVWVPMDPSDSCCVCLSEFCSAETVRTLRCGHTFHQQCIDEWLTKQAVCPLCKSAVTAVIEVADEISSETFRCGSTCRLWWASQPTLTTGWTGMRLDQHDVALAVGASP